jgi:hypothetical protein
VLRLVALSVLALVALVLGGVALARALVSMREERKRKRAVLDRQREADLREQAGRREQRERAKDALGDARDLEVALGDVRWTWTTGGYVETTNTGAQARTWTTTIENSQPVLVPEPARSHPLGWTAVGLPGGVLCAVEPVWDRMQRGDTAPLVDYFGPPLCAWVRLRVGETLYAEALAAAGQA